MLKRAVQSTLGWFGYQLVPVPKVRRPVFLNGHPAPPMVDPVWPLPRRNGLTDAEIRDGWSAFDQWHYAYAFDGGLSFPVRRGEGSRTKLADQPDRPLLRFRHFMPWLVAACGGSLKGKRVLDMAGNSGFWSIQCALLGAAEVVHFDGQQRMIEEAQFLKRTIGLENLTIWPEPLDVMDATPALLGGQFDIVLNLGLLYHVSDNLGLLERTKALSRDIILLDTSTHPVDDKDCRIRIEMPVDSRTAPKPTVVFKPSQAAVKEMLEYLRFREFTKILPHNRDVPPDFLNGQRACWLIRV
jgi:tRNA (mo5U34)-methyltransferase